MDVLSIIGLVVGIGAILGGNLLEGGHLGSLVNGPALIIVFGGTLAQFKQVGSAAKCLAACASQYNRAQ